MQINQLHRIAPAARSVAGLATIAAATALVLLGGCRQEEQNRPIHYEKGAELQTAPLDQEAAQTLRYRATKQNFGL